MASQTGCEIMNIEIVDSILIVFLIKRKKMDFLMFKNLYNSVKATMRAIRSYREVTPIP